LFFRVTPAPVAEQKSETAAQDACLLRALQFVSGEAKLHQGKNTGAQKIVAAACIQRNCDEEKKIRKKKKARRRPGSSIIFVEMVTSQVLRSDA
jgi:hypothetical protein